VNTQAQQPSGGKSQLLPKLTAKSQQNAGAPVQQVGNFFGVSHHLRFRIGAQISIRELDSQNSVHDFMLQ
jgi:hypothetical protein